VGQIPAERVRVHHEGEPDLPNVVQALRRLRLLAGLVERRQEDRNQERNDADDDEQLYKREGVADAVATSGRMRVHGILPASGHGKRKQS
jgi:hypothetical protein